MKPFTSKIKFEVNNPTESFWGSVVQARGGKGGTPIYWLYGYVPLERVWSIWSGKGYGFQFIWSGKGYAFQTIWSSKGYGFQAIWSSYYRKLV